MASITKFYSGRTVLVTGGTGFMGKVLLEKMLRSLPDIKKVYVLLREKRGVNPDDRISAMTSALPFTFHKMDTETKQKLIAIHGDITKDNLGLSTEDKQVLIDEVSVVFHLAASIRMDLSLKDALILNTISTQKVLNLCLEMQHLAAVVHLSTAYCNVDIENMEEKIYKVRLDPYKIIDMVEWMDDEGLKRVEESVIKPHPNSYTFSKRLAEIVAVDMGKKLPVSIGRPSIVIPSLIEPVPGWVDNYNGPTGLLAAAGKGVLRSILADTNTCPQVVPVDLAINALIIMACIRATENFADTPIYNLTQGNIVQLTWDEAVEKFRKMAMKHPFKQMMWYPGGSGTRSVILHKLTVIFFHMLPAYIIDFLLVLFMQKPFMVNIQNRLNVGLKLLSYFALKKFTFTNENTVKLDKYVDPSEFDSFPVGNAKYDVDDYLTKAFFGAKYYCFKESPRSEFICRLQITFFYLLDKIFKIMLLYGLLWIVLKAFGMTQILSWNSKLQAS